MERGKSFQGRILGSVLTLGDESVTCPGLAPSNTFLNCEEQWVSGGILEKVRACGEEKRRGGGVGMTRENISRSAFKLSHYLEGLKRLVSGPGPIRRIHSREGEAQGVAVNLVFDRPFAAQVVFPESEEAPRHDRGEEGVHNRDLTGSVSFAQALQQA